MEVRKGKLLGPAQPVGRPAGAIGNVPHEGHSLVPKQTASKYRALAAREDLVLARLAPAGGTRGGTVAGVSLPAIPPSWPHDPAGWYDALDTAADVFARWLAPPAWHARAACRGAGPGRFFAEGRGVREAAAVEFCARCPVVVECAEFAATAVPPVVGVWGGRIAGHGREMAV